MPMHVDSYGFGRIRVDGVAYSKDVIIIGEKVLSPWWRQAGGHVFAPEDLQRLIEAAPATVVLGTGYFGLVTVRQDTLDALAEVGSEVICERTARAVERFNRLSAQGQNVAAALHLTC